MLLKKRANENCSSDLKQTHAGVVTSTLHIDQFNKIDPDIKGKRSVREEQTEYIQLLLCSSGR